MCVCTRVTNVRLVSCTHTCTPVHAIRQGWEQMSWANMARYKCSDSLGWPQAHSWGRKGLPAALGWWLGVWQRNMDSLDKWYLEALHNSFTMTCLRARKGLVKCTHYAHHWLLESFPAPESHGQFTTNAFLSWQLNALTALIELLKSNVVHFCSNMLDHSRKCSSPLPCTLTSYNLPSIKIKVRGNTPHTKRDVIIHKFPLLSSSVLHVSELLLHPKSLK